MDLLFTAAAQLDVIENDPIMIDGHQTLPNNTRNETHVTSQSQQQRVKQTRVLIQHFSKQGVRAATIADHLNINVDNIYRWRSRATTDDASRSGRLKRSLSPNTKSMITNLCKDKWNASIRKTTKCLNASESYISRQKTISATAVGDYIRSTDWGCVARKATVAPMLSAKNIQDRTAFSSMIMEEGYCRGDDNSRFLLDHILFTDESYIELFPCPNRQNTRIRTSDPILRTPTMIPKHSLKILVAGGLSARGLSKLHISPPNVTVTGDYYRSCVLPVYFSTLNRAQQSEQIDETCLFDESESAVFMQDGAPAHTARCTLELVHRHFRRVWSKNVWPGNSPDLNPIEHLWSMLQEAVFTEPRPRNREELITRVQYKWRSISADLTGRLVHSFPTRILQCLQRNGHSTDY
jgi:hypothetical protein